jgi:putative serine protease PepD
MIELVVAVVLAVASTPLPVEPAYTTDPAPALTLSQAIAKTKPSIVRIRAESATVANSGSGVIADDGGHVLTNYHVIEGESTPVRGGMINSMTIKVGLSDGRWLVGRVTAVDEARDLAVVSVEPAGLRPIVIGRSSSLEVGEEVVAIGYPLGLEGDATATRGILSARRVAVAVDLSYLRGGSPLGASKAVAPALLQVDAALNPGSSGGALIDRWGRLVGISTSIVRFGECQVPVQGMGFAIAIDEAMPTIAALTGRNAS